MITINFDGCCMPVNPGGVACYGVVIKNTANNSSVDLKGVVGEGEGMSNNVAEYAALQAALEFLIRKKVNVENYVIVFYGDSQLVIRQMIGKWKVNDGMYVSNHDKVVELLRSFRSKPTFNWIPREQNARADMLSHDAYKEYQKIRGGLTNEKPKNDSGNER